MAKSVLDNAFWFASYQELASLLQTYLSLLHQVMLNLGSYPVCHLALGCAVLRRDIAKEGKRPWLFPEPMRGTWATFLYSNGSSSFL